jgi:hypothetical protein
LLGLGLSLGPGEPLSEGLPVGRVGDCVVGSSVGVGVGSSVGVGVGSSVVGSSDGDSVVLVGDGCLVGDGGGV